MELKKSKNKSLDFHLFDQKIEQYLNYTQKGKIASNYIQHSPKINFNQYNSSLQLSNFFPTNIQGNNSSQPKTQKSYCYTEETTYPKQYKPQQNYNDDSNLNIQQKTKSQSGVKKKSNDQVKKNIPQSKHQESFSKEQQEYSNSNHVNNGNSNMVNIKNSKSASNMDIQIEQLQDLYLNPDFNQFQKRQEQYLKKTNEKIQSMKQTFDKQFQDPKPIINQNSKNLVEKSCYFSQASQKYLPVNERLLNKQNLAFNHKTNIFQVDQKKNSSSAIQSQQNIQKLKKQQDNSFQQIKDELFSQILQTGQINSTQSQQSLLQVVDTQSPYQLKEIVVKQSQARLLDLSQNKENQENISASFQKYFQSMHESQDSICMNSSKKKSPQKSPQKSIQDSYKTKQLSVDLFVTDRLYECQMMKNYSPHSKLKTINSTNKLEMQKKINDNTVDSLINSSAKKINLVMKEYHYNQKKF